MTSFLGSRLPCRISLSLQRPAPASPHAARHRGGDVFGEAEHFSDFADGAARAIADDSRGQCGAVMAIAGVNILNDFFAPLMLEIDIDIRRFFALLAK